MPDTSSPAVLLSGIAFVLETPDDAARQRFRDILSELALSTKKPVARPTEEHEPRMAIAFSDTMPDLEGMRIRHGRISPRTESGNGPLAAVWAGAGRRLSGFLSMAH